MASSPLTYAIDFGTSNSLLGAASNTQTFPPIRLDETSKDPTVMRSLLYFKNAKEIFWGQKALNEYIQQDMTGRLLRSFKRFLPAKDFQGTVIASKLWKLEDIIALFLKNMRLTANSYFDQDVTSVILGRPALFSEDLASDKLAQDRLEKAAQLAGFTQIEFLPEPVAAAYRYRLELEKEETVLIADFGGGTSDYTLIKLSKSPFQPSDVLSIGGVPLAGDALDGSIMRNRLSENFGSKVRYQVPFGQNILSMPRSLMMYLCSTAHIQLLMSRENTEFLRQVKTWSLDESDKRALNQLTILLEDQLGFSIFEAIEAAKIQLSHCESGEVVFNYPGITVNESISRAQFAEYSRFESHKIADSLDETLKKAGLTYENVDRVCCTGGTAQAYVIRQELEKRFPLSKLDNFNNFSSVVEGLTQRAYQLLST